MVDEPRYNVLFLCTGNSARSIMAESLLRAEAGDRFHAFSAGSAPQGEVHPIALETLERAGLPIDGLRLKSWDELAAHGTPGGSAAHGTPELHFVFTVCDNAAGEACPVWPGQPMTAHWGIEDPAAVDGTPVEQRAAFERAFRYLKARVTQFAALPLASLDRLTIQARLEDIGRRPGASRSRNAPGTAASEPGRERIEE